MRGYLFFIFQQGETHILVLLTGELLFNFIFAAYIKDMQNSTQTSHFIAILKFIFLMDSNQLTFFYTTKFVSCPEFTFIIFSSMLQVFSPLFFHLEFWNNFSLLSRYQSLEVDTLMFTSFFYIFLVIFKVSFDLCDYFHMSVFPNKCLHSFRIPRCCIFEIF